MSSNKLPRKNIHVEYNIGKIIINGKELATPKHLTTIFDIDLSRVIGRKDDLDEITTLFQQFNKVVLMNASRGIGKTTLAKAFLKKHQNNYKHIAWLDASNGIKNAFVGNVQLRDSLGLHFPIEEKTEEFLGQAFEVIIRQMQNLQGNHLLILNSIQKDDKYMRMISKMNLGPNWKMLATSCQDLEDFKEYKLGVLSHSDATCLFYDHKTTEKNDEVLNEILKLVDYRTLDIVTIAKAGQSLQLSLLELLELLNKNGLAYFRGEHFFLTRYFQ